MKTREVLPCGILRTFDQTYYLLRPSPEKPRTNWETWNTFRWLVVPYCPLEILDSLDIYDYARYIITTSFTVEFWDNPIKITIKVLDQYDVMEEELDGNS